MSKASPDIMPLPASDSGKAQRKRARTASGVERVVRPQATPITQQRGVSAPPTGRPSGHLTRAEATAILRRCAELAATIEGPKPNEALDALGPLRQDLLAAIAGAFAEGDATVAARGVVALARLECRTEHAQQALLHFEVPAVKLAAAAPDARASFYLEGAIIALSAGRPSVARTFHERLAATSGVDRALLCRRQWLGGRIHLAEGRWAEARRSLDAARDLSKKVGDKVGEALALQAQGDLHRALGSDDAAADAYDAARQLNHRAGAAEREIACTLGLADSYARLGNEPAARDQYERAEEHSVRVGAPSLTARALGGIGILAALEGRDVDALHTFDRALAISAHCGPDPSAPEAHSPRTEIAEAILLTSRGDIGRALACATEAANLAPAASSARALALSLEGAIRTSAGMHSIGAECLDEATRMARALGDTPTIEAVAALHTLARLHREGESAFGEVHAAHFEMLGRPPRDPLLRLAVRLLLEAVDARGWRARCRSLPECALLLEQNATRFRLSDRAVSGTVSLGREGPTSRLLATLARERRRTPGVTLPAAELIARVWPGERIVPKAAKNRLHVALSRLRKAGLAKHVERIEDGYRLSASVVPVFVDTL